MAAIATSGATSIVSLDVTSRNVFCIGENLVSLTRLRSILGRHGSDSLCRDERENKMAAIHTKY